MSVSYSGTYTNGIVLHSPATQNPATVATTGYVYNPGATALFAAAGTAWTIDNYGAIGGGSEGAPASAVGVDLGAGGGTLVNAGTIVGQNAVRLGSGDTLIDTGYIAGRLGVRLAAGDTMVAAGRVITTGHTAVQFAADPGNRLILDAGAYFQQEIIQGGVTASGTETISGGGGTVELAGSVVRPGGDFVDFNAVVVDAGLSSGFLTITNLPTLVNYGRDFAIAGGFGPGQQKVTTIENYGGLSLNSYATVAAATNHGTIFAGGTITSLTNDGTVIANDGSVLLGVIAESGSGGILEVAQNTTLRLEGAVAAGQTVVFVSHSGLLALDEPAGFAGSVTGFQGGATIDVAGIVADGFAYSGGVLSLTQNGTTVAQLTLSTPYAEPGFMLTADGYGGTLLTIEPLGNVFSGFYPDGVVLSDPPSQNPATITTTGYIGNSGSPGVALLGEAGTPWTVANYGTIKSSGAGPSAFGIDLQSGGSVANAGFILGNNAIITFDPAIVISGGPGAVSNTGFVGGVYFADGGSVTNAAEAGIQGAEIGFPAQTETTGVVIRGAPGTVLNQGTIGGIYLAAGGSVTNGQAGESGALIGSTTPIYPPSQNAPGVMIAGTGVVTNFGTIAGNMIDIPGVGRISYAAVRITGSGAVINYGTVLVPGIVSGGHTIVSSTGVELDAGGTLRNSGSIGGGVGVAMDGASYIGNSGAISAAGTAGSGVYLDASGVTLVNSGTIAGAAGVSTGAGDTAGDTIVNAGTIAGYGGTAIALGTTGDVVVVEPGAVFLGTVEDGGSGLIELAAGTGILGGLGTSFAGFRAIEVDPGASWAISGGGSNFVNDGTVTVYGALSFGTVTHDTGEHGIIDLGNNGSAEFSGAVTKGETLVFTDSTAAALLDRPFRFKAMISGFAAGDVIDLVGTQADTLDFANHQLVVAEASRTVADLHFTGHYTTADFALSPDGNGGTDISLRATTASQFWTLQA